MFRIRVSIPSSTIEGTVYTVDPSTSLLVLNTSSSTASTAAINTTTLTAPAGPYRILHLSQIQSFQVLTLPGSSSTNHTAPASDPLLDPNALQARLNHAISNLQSAQLRVGPKGTSPTDQALFDALSRTHPTRWEGSHMVISDTFVIEKPYGAVNVGFYSDNAGTRKGDLERMRKVVDMERNKCLLRLGQREVEGRMAGQAGAGAKKGG